MPGLPLPTREAPPPLLKLSCFLKRAGIRGSWRLESALRRLGYLDVAVRYRLGERVQVTVPLDEPNYDFSEIQTYDEDAVRLVEQLLEGRGSPVTLIDCGADVGLVTAHLVNACPAIERVIAFEPNRRAFPYLEHNLGELPLQQEARPAAVADFLGRGELSRPAWDPSDHAAFLEPREGGSVPVETIDSLELGAIPILLLKIDVEGGELAVLRGARQTLRAAGDFLVIFEAHPRQAARSGVDPWEIVGFLQEIRPCRPVAPLCPDLALWTDRPLWDQIPGAAGENLNVCVFTETLARLTGM